MMHFLYRIRAPRLGSKQLDEYMKPPVKRDHTELIGSRVNSLDGFIIIC